MRVKTVKRWTDKGEMVEGEAGNRKRGDMVRSVFNFFEKYIYILYIIMSLTVICLCTLKTFLKTLPGASVRYFNSLFSFHQVRFQQLYLNMVQPNWVSGIFVLSIYDKFSM